MTASRFEKDFYKNALRAIKNKGHVIVHSTSSLSIPNSKGRSHYVKTFECIKIEKAGNSFRFYYKGYYSETYITISQIKSIDLPNSDIESFQKELEDNQEIIVKLQNRCNEINEIIQWMNDNNLDNFNEEKFKLYIRLKDVENYQDLSINELVNVLSDE